ncbi:uncharacterized protein LOC108162897 isoform X2 [Drosophila miranda]|nr:uncharacterized protein LOC108162897 isoform X2 [Drosophila miranda]
MAKFNENLPIELDEKLPEIIEENLPKTIEETLPKTIEENLIELNEISAGSTTDKESNNFDQIEKLVSQSLENLQSITQSDATNQGSIMSFVFPNVMSHLRRSCTNILNKIERDSAHEAATQAPKEEPK